jgi:hypothetical protein
MIADLVFSLGGYMKPKINKKTLLVPKASGEARCVWFTTFQ